MVAVLEDPEDAVAAFYARVVEAEFEAAYALWSDRMKAQFLVRRTSRTIRRDRGDHVHRLHTVERSVDRALVQANFVEDYESGVSREFVGYWELVLVDGRWLLDQPHY